MMQNRFEFYSFKNRSISNKKIFEYNKVCKEIGELKAKLDASINQLKLINPNMVLMTAFELVELSHRWRSWKLAMYVANLNDKGSSRIDVSDIRNYPQFFVL